MTYYRSILGNKGLIEDLCGSLDNSGDYQSNKGLFREISNYEVVAENHFHCCLGGYIT